uniref:Uncharacterized protein n=1 Tax=Tanacetum cinerariifolium TaxID=118510 RepID=A0A6L2KTJ5_TANCI|nr:hypothetical protein [Tanacetum cinerariifolium]
MRRVGKGIETPLFETMLAVSDIAEKAEAQVPAQGDDVREHVAEEVANDVVPPTPTSPSPSSPIIQSLPPYQSPCPPQQKDAEGSSQLFQQIVKLKARVKKLERLNKVKSSKLRRLKKVGTSQRAESSDDVENVFNQGRNIVDMDQDEGIELVLSMQEDDTEVQEAVEVVTTAKLITEVVTAVATQVAAASTPIYAAKPKTLSITAAPAKDQVEMDAEYAKKLQEELDKEHEESYKNIDWDAVLDHVQSKEPLYDANMKFLFKTKEEMEKEDEEIIKSFNEAPAQKAAKRRKQSEEAQEADDLKKRLEIVQDEDDDVFVEAIPLSQKVPVVDYQVVVIDNKPKYKIIRADDTHQFYISFTTLLKNFDREDLETL